MTSPLLSMQEDQQEVRSIIIQAPERTWLGVRVSDVSAELLDLKTLPDGEGAYVIEVIRDSPADSAGLREGDVIIRFGNRIIYDAEGLVHAVRRTEVDKPVPVTYIRNGRQQHTTVTLRERERGRRAAIRIPRQADTPRMAMVPRYGRLGINTIDLSPQLGEYFQVPDGKGVLVEHVHQNTPAENAGIRAGDVIIKIGDARITSTRELRRALRAYTEGEVVAVEVVRRGQRQTFHVEIQHPGFWFDFDFDFNFDPEVFELEIFGPRGSEKFREDLERKIEVELTPRLEQFRTNIEEIRDKLNDLKVNLQEQIRKEIGTCRVHE